MSDVYQALKEFFNNSSACSQALRPLKKGVEIRVVLFFDSDQSREMALFHDGSKACLEEREAQKVDVAFHISPAAAEVLLKSNPDDIGDIAVNILKQITEREVQIKVVSSIFGLLKNGYLEIIKLGGKPLWNYLL